MNPDVHDARAERIPAAPPSGPRPESTPRVAVVGGGIAGLAAACGLAERGVDVVVFEREPGLGGRLRGWDTTLADGSTVTMSRGFHAFFRQYYNLRGLLRRTDPELAGLVPLPDYPLVHASGARDRFSGLPTTPPWNAFALAATSPSFPLAGLAGVNVPAVLQLLDVDVPGVHERLGHRSARELLEVTRFPTTARHLAFEVFSRSFFAAPEQLSAAEMAVMFHLYFLGSAEGLVFDVPRSPFPQALWDPLERYLRDLGVEFRTGVAVERILPGERLRHAVRWARAEGAQGEEFDALVLAADPRGLRGLVERSPQLGTADPQGRHGLRERSPEPEVQDLQGLQGLQGLGERSLGGSPDEWRGRVARVPSAPPFLVSRYWLNKPVRAHRQAFLGTAGYATLDNISVLERYEDQAREWARRTGGSVVELHAYALPEGCDVRAERKSLWRQAVAVYPELAVARVVDARHELRADCALFPPGGYAERCTTATPDPTVVVAGDHVRVDLPVALMEGAATSGFLAANALLSRWGREGHTLWTVPRRGRSAVLRALARVARRPGSTARPDAQPSSLPDPPPAAPLSPPPGAQPGQRPEARSR